MKYLLVSMLAVALAGFNDIAKVNKAKEEAKKAYLDQDYALAVTKYQYLIDSLGVKDDRAQLNLSHAYLLTQDTTAAMQGYNMLANDRTPANIRSIANQQMGVITSAQNKKQLALEYFKQALRANPSNEEARFNYELIKKELEEEQKQKEQEQENQEEQKDDQQKQEDQEQKEQEEKQQQEQQQKEQEESNQQDGEEEQEENKGDQEDQEAQEQEEKGKESEEEQAKQDEEASEEQQADQEPEQNEEKAQEQKEAALMEKLDNLENMDRDQALMYLEAMKNNEIQYLQQNKRKATKKVDRSKPDW
ncbi:MAG: hypothetical protein ACR2MX_18270 [Cyclobacteriaceae bacterium]